MCNISPSLDLVELVDLLSHLGDGVVVLLAKQGEGRLVLDVGLLQVPPEFAQLSLALLVELYLGGGGATCLLESLAEFLELPGQVAPLLLGLGAGLTLGLDLLLEFLDAGLQLLHLLLLLAHQGLLVLELGRQGRELLVLALDRLLELLLVPLQVGHRLLGELEVTLDLPLGLLDIGTATFTTMSIRISQGKVGCTSQNFPEIHQKDNS